MKVPAYFVAQIPRKVNLSLNSITVTAVLVLVSFCLAKPYISKAFLRYDHTLIGGDVTAGAFFQVTSAFVLSGHIGTQQTFNGWQGFDGLVRGDFSMLDLPLRFTPRGFIWLGGNYETVSIDGRTPSPSLSQAGNSFHRISPTFGIGIAVDSLEFFCQSCPYYIWAEAAVGDFISQKISFISSSPGETLSLSAFLSTRVSTPYGDAIVRKRLRVREWFGDNIWRLEYKTPLLCYDVLRFGAGWETGFLGFANAEITIAPISIFLYASLPKNVSAWRWGLGIGFIPSVPFSAKCKSCARVQIPWY